MGAVLPGPQSSLPLSISVFRADSPAYICECPDCNGETRSCVQGLSLFHDAEFGEQTGDFAGVLPQGGGDIPHAFGA